MKIMKIMAVDHLVSLEGLDSVGNRASCIPRTLDSVNICEMHMMAFLECFTIPLLSGGGGGIGIIRLTRRRLNIAKGSVYTRYT